MIPMVTCIDEYREARELIEEIKKELEEKKIPYNKPYEVTTMFKVKKQEHINKTFRMPVELVASLEELAAKKEVSLNQLVIQCCAYALAHLADDDS